MIVRLKRYIAHEQGNLSNILLEHVLEDIHKTVCIKVASLAIESEVKTINRERELEPQRLCYCEKCHEVHKPSDLNTTYAPHLNNQGRFRSIPKMLSHPYCLVDQRSEEWNPHHLR